MWPKALSTMASAVTPLYFLRIFFSREPELTPIRIDMPASLAQSTTALTFLALPILPGLILKASAPARVAAMANRWSKWISAIRGIKISFLMARMASAAWWSGTATLIISHPALCKRLIWETVASTSAVGVVVMDCTETGAIPPTGTFPTFIRRVFFRLKTKAISIYWILFFVPSCLSGGTLSLF